MWNSLCKKRMVNLKYKVSIHSFYLILQYLTHSCIYAYIQTYMFDRPVIIAYKKRNSKQNITSKAHVYELQDDNFFYRFFTSISYWTDDKIISIIFSLDRIVIICAWLSIFFSFHNNFLSILDIVTFTMFHMNVIFILFCSVICDDNVCAFVPYMCVILYLQPSQYLLTVNI